MAVTIETPVRISANVWRLSFTSDLVDPVFTIYKNGVFLATTSNNSYDIPIESGSSPVLTVNDDNSVPDKYPERFLLFWQKADGADSYVIQRDTGAGFNQVDVVQDTGAMYYSFLTSVLEDSIIHSFRIIPAASGNLGTAVDFNSLMVKIPAVPDVSYSYDSGTGSVTIT